MQALLCPWAQENPDHMKNQYQIPEFVTMPSWKKNNNLLLTEREGRTGEYWPEVVAERTERSEVRTKTTEG